MKRPLAACVLLALCCAWGARAQDDQLRLGDPLSLLCKDNCPDASCFQLTCLTPVQNNRARFRLTISSDCFQQQKGSVDFLTLLIGDRCYP